MYLFNLLVVLVWQLGIWWLLETFEDSKNCFVYIFSDIELVIFDAKFIFLSLTLPVAIGLNTFWFQKSLGITKLIKGYFIYSSSRRMLFAKKSFKWISTKSSSQHIWNFIQWKHDMPVLRQYGHWFNFRFAIIRTFFVSLTFCILLFKFQFFLTNLQNILKCDILATKSEDYQLAKKVLQVVSIHMLRQLCYWHSWHVLKSLLIIRQSVPVPVELVGKLDN